MQADIEDPYAAMYNQPGMGTQQGKPLPYMAGPDIANSTSGRYYGDNPAPPIALNQPPLQPTPDLTGAAQPNAAPAAPASGNSQDIWNSITGGKPLNQQGLLALAPQLRQAGFNISPANEQGAVSKIQTPDGQWVRVLDGDTSQTNPTVWMPQPGGAVAGDSSASAGTAGTSSTGGFTSMPSIYSASSNANLAGQSNKLYDLLMGIGSGTRPESANPNFNISVNDPIIRSQVDAFGANNQRSQRNYLSQLAEQASTTGGGGANISAETRRAAEAGAQSTATFQGQLMSQELAARRQEVESALSGASGMLTAQQQLALTEELTQISTAERAYEFDTTQQYLNSPLAPGANG